MRTASAGFCWALSRAGAAANSTTMPTATMPKYNALVVLMSLLLSPTAPLGALPRDHGPGAGAPECLRWLSLVLGHDCAVFHISAARGRAAQRASGSGRSWNRTTFGRFSLPPSRWNIVLVE